MHEEGASQETQRTLDSATHKYHRKKRDDKQTGKEYVQWHLQVSREDLYKIRNGFKKENNTG